MRALLRRALGSDPHMAELVRGGGLAFGGKALGLLALLAFQALLGRTLGADGAGLFFLALTVVTVASVLGRLGLDHAVLRFASASAGEGDAAGVAGVARRGLGAVLVASALVAALLWALAPALAGGVFGKPELGAPLRGLALGAIPLALLFLLAQLLKAVGRIGLSQLLQNAAPPVLALAACLPLLEGFAVGDAVGAYVAALVAAALLAALAWRSAAPRPAAAAAAGPNAPGARRLAAAAAPLYAASALALVLEWLPTLTLGAFGTKAELGLFHVAGRTALLTSFALAALNNAAAPKFAALHARGERAALERTARRSALLMAAAAAPFLLLFVLFPAPVMRLFGPEFAAGAPLLAILAAGQFVNAAAGSVGYLLMMSGNGDAFRNATAVAAGLQALLCLLLIPPFGGLGAALAATAGTIGLNALAAVLAAARLGIQPVPLPGLRAAARELPGA